MHPRDHIDRAGAGPALIMAGTGESISFAELDARANAASHLFRSLGLKPGERVALWMENDPRYLEIVWGAYNAGLLYVPVNSRLKAEEAAFVIGNSDARVVIASAGLDHARLAREIGDVRLLIVGGPASWEAATSAMPTSPITDETRGVGMLYSSGTTGRPKGILPILLPEDIGVPHDVSARQMTQYAFGPDMVYLSPAPIYHSAPLRYCMSTQQVGGTVVMMDKFEPSLALHHIDAYRVTHAQFVPTMFVRMLQLPHAERAQFNGSSLRYAIHAASPCPAEIKRRMIDWWGPIIHEYYGGSEGVGQTAISPEETLERPGSVGKAVRGTIHILDDDEDELGTGQTGTIFFEGGSRFVYHKDPEKTARSFSKQGWGTYGDIGHVDQDGYLYLTDRRDYTMIIGGVNVYPQEAENVLAAHPAVADVAVFGIPHKEYGEEVKAVVLPEAHGAGPELEAELLAWCRERLTLIKCPRSIDFTSELPREPSGKLLKRLLKAPYWPLA